MQHSHECDHTWLISNWKIDKHSQSAQELLCQKCAYAVNVEMLNNLRATSKQHPDQRIVPHGTVSPTSHNGEPGSNPAA